jgi:hypothetical protein
MTNKKTEIAGVVLKHIVTIENLNFLIEVWLNHLP